MTRDISLGAFCGTAIPFKLLNIRGTPETPVISADALD
jgi:hypothetical protein